MYLKRVLLGMLAILILLAAGAGIFYLQNLSNTGTPISNDTQAYAFSGAVQAVEADGTVRLKGVILSPKGDLSGELKDSHVFSFKTDSNTKIEKIEIFFPAAAELEKTGGVYKLDDLQKRTSSSSIDDIRKLVGTQTQVNVSFRDSIINSKNPVAASVTYWVDIIP